MRLFDSRFLCGSALLGVSLTAALPLIAQTKPLPASKTLLARVADAPGRKVSRLPGKTTAKARKNDFQSVSALRQHIKELSAQPDEDAEASLAKLMAVAGKELKKQPRMEGNETLNAYRAMLYYTQQRAFPNDTINWDAYGVAMKRRDRMPVLNLDALGVVEPKGPASKPGSRSINAIAPPPINAGAKWSYAGPRDYTAYRLYFGPDAAIGRVNAVTFDPGNANTFYLAAAKGGIWKTTNGGKSWVALTDSQPGLAFSSVAVDPNNSNTIWAGTGDYDGGDGASYGILKSTDGGKTWVNKGLTGDAIRKILVDPTNSSSVYAAVGFSGLSHSANGGATWTRLLSASRASDVVFNSDRTALYCSMDFDGVYKSTDGGVSWSQVLGSAGARMDVAASLIDPNTAYVVDGGSASVFKTTDGGANWANTTNNLPVDRDKTGDAKWWSQAFYDFYIGVSKGVLPGVGGVGNAPTGTPTDVVYVGLLNVYQSTDAGGSWADIGQGWTGNDLLHTDQHAFAANPNNPNDMLIGNDGGVYRLAYNQEQNTDKFTSLNAALGITQFYAAGFDPHNPLDIIGGSQDNGTPHINGNPLKWDEASGGDGGYCGIEPSVPATQFSSSQSDVVGTSLILPVNKTDTFWNSSIGIPCNCGDPTMDNAGFIYPIILDNTGPKQLYTGSRRLWHFDGAAWTEQTDGATTNPVKYLAGPFGYVSAIATAYTKSQKSTITYVGTVDGNVWVYLPNADATKNNLFIPINGNLPGRSITSLTVSVGAPRRVFATLSGSGSPHLWRNDNAGFAGWIDISGTGGPSPLPDIPANALVILPHDDEQAMFVGTDIGVFGTTDGGKTWKNATAPLGLPNADIRTLGFQATTGNLYAATYGRGIWQLVAGNNIPFQMYPLLQYYRGSKANLSVKVEFYHANPQVVRPTPVEIRSGVLSAAGWYKTNISVLGYYDAYVTIPRFLRKRLANIYTGKTPITGQPVFYAGDVNGDNVIDQADVNAVKAAMGRFTNDLVDVDGDGVVTQRDVDIVTANLGRRGD